MVTPSQITMIKLDNLNIDLQNPRLPMKLRSSTDKREIIDWMLLDASIIELMLAIGQSGFFIGEPLLVVNRKDSNYDVIEGNRRLSALMLLSDPMLASVQKNKVSQVISETNERPKLIPCIIFETREEITQYLGYRHVTGIKSWGVLSKARYLTGMLDKNYKGEFSAQCKDLAKSIGSRSDYVRKLLVAYKIYEYVEDESFFRISDLNETTLHFNYLSDSLSKKNIRNYIGLSDDLDLCLNGIDKSRLENLTRWFFEKEQGRSRVLGSSSDLKKLDEILGDASAREYFLDGKGSLSEAYDLFKASADSFHRELIIALQGLKRAKEYEHMIEVHHNTDIATLAEIFNLCKSLKGAIETKGKDDDEF